MESNLNVESMRCRKCGQIIEGEGFGSSETGWEHPFSCPPNADPVGLLKSEMYDIVDEVEPLYTAGTADPVLKPWVCQCGTLNGNNDTCYNCEAVRPAESVEAQKQRITAAIKLIDAAQKTEESFDHKNDDLWRFLDAANRELYDALRQIDGVQKGRTDG